MAANGSADVAQAARPAGRADAPLPARLSVLLQPAGAGAAHGRARRRDLGAGVPSRPPGSACCRCICPAASRRRGATCRRSRRTRAKPGSTPTSSPRASACTTAAAFATLSEAGLDHVQISIQDSEAVSADHIAGYRRRLRAQDARSPRRCVRLGLPLTVNLVVHRANIERIGAMVDLALALGASRIEIAHVQYYGWALKNRAALMPTREQVERAAVEVEVLRKKHHGQIVIDAVVPDYHARFPKPCVGGWGRRSLNVTPSGKVLPCHAAESFPAWNSGTCRTIRSQTSGRRRRPSTPSAAPIFCRSPARAASAARSISAAAAARLSLLTGDARATDPVCHMSPAPRAGRRTRRRAGGRGLRLPRTARRSPLPSIASARLKVGDLTAMEARWPMRYLIG